MMFIHRIRVENMLSFGPDAQELELKPLNVANRTQRLRKIEPHRSDWSPAGYPE